MIDVVRGLLWLLQARITEVKHCLCSHTGTHMAHITGRSLLQCGIGFSAPQLQTII